MNKSNFIKLATSLAAPLLAGLIGSSFTFSEIPNWYAHLVRPTLAPPNWVFGPVWTTLYILMGIAMFLVWKKGIETKYVRGSLTVFYGQLILNALWSIVFFGGHDPLGGFVVIVLLWLSILACIGFFSKVSRTAAWLLVPYLVWVSFASYLNFSIFMLN